EEAVVLESRNGFQIDGAANGVGIQIGGEGLVDGHGVQQVGGHTVQHDAAAVLRGGGADAIDGHGVEVGVHAAHGHIAALALVVFHHDAGNPAQGFGHIDVGKIAHGV